MKIRDVVKLMNDDTQIFVYTESAECMNNGSSICEYECDECIFRDLECVEFCKYRGTAGDCPIKIAEYEILSIDCKERTVTGKRKRDTHKAATVAMRVGL